MEQVTAKDIMTAKVIFVSPKTPLLEAAKLLINNDFHGLPVVDENKKLKGILTEYDLISKSSLIHLPTLQVVLQNLNINEDNSALKKEQESIRDLKVEDVMNPEPLTLFENDPYGKVLEAFREHHRVNPIPVVDADNKVIGVISRFDVLKPLDGLS